MLQNCRCNTVEKLPIISMITEIPHVHSSYYAKSYWNFTTNIMKYNISIKTFICRYANGNTCENITSRYMIFERPSGNTLYLSIGCFIKDVNLT